MQPVLVEADIGRMLPEDSHQRHVCIRNKTIAFMETFWE